MKTAAVVFAVSMLCLFVGLIADAASDLQDTQVPALRGRVRQLETLCEELRGDAVLRARVTEQLELYIAAHDKHLKAHGQALDALRAAVLAPYQRGAQDGVGR